MLARERAAMVESADKTTVYPVVLFEKELRRRFNSTRASGDESNKWFTVVTLGGSHLLSNSYCPRDLEVKGLLGLIDAAISTPAKVGAGETIRRQFSTVRTLVWVGGCLLLVESCAPALVLSFDNSFKCRQPDRANGSEIDHFGRLECCE